MKELVLPSEDGTGPPRLRFAIAYGFRNIQTIVNKMRRSKTTDEYANEFLHSYFDKTLTPPTAKLLYSLCIDNACALSCACACARVGGLLCRYHFVEIMACPSGCLNGGAQVSAGKTAPATSPNFQLLISLSLSRFLSFSFSIFPSILDMPPCAPLR